MVNKIERKTKEKWSPLENANDAIKDLEFAVNRCTPGGDVAKQSAFAYGNIEAAFYEKEIDEDKMVEMKRKVRSMISIFDEKCKCVRRK